MIRKNVHLSSACSSVSCFVLSDSFHHYVSEERCYTKLSFRFTYNAARECAWLIRLVVSEALGDVMFGLNRALGTWQAVTHAEAVVAQWMRCIASQMWVAHIWE